MEFREMQELLLLLLTALGLRLLNKRKIALF